METSKVLFVSAVLLTMLGACVNIFFPETAIRISSRVFGKGQNTPPFFQSAAIVRFVGFLGLVIGAAMILLVLNN
jgi:hypothetical protein